MQIANCWTTAVVSTARIGLIILTLLAGNMLAPHAWAQSASTTATPDGLKGLLPADPPIGILNALERFPATWESWTSSMESELNAFYRETPNDVAGQRAALERLRTRSRTIDQALADSQYNSIRNDLFELRGTLITQIDVLVAVLDTLTEQKTPAYANSATQGLLGSLNNLEAFLDGANGGPAWKIYLRTAEVHQDLASAMNSRLSFDGLQASLSKLNIARKSTDSAVRGLCDRAVFKNYFLDLDRVVAAFQLEKTGIGWSDVRSEIKTLLTELEKYDQSKLLSSAGQVRATYDRLRRLCPNGGDRLTLVLRQHYFNSNFQASISEGFLNRVMATSRTEAGGVRDFILGADVFGTQTTSTNSTVNLVADPAVGHLQIQLSGNVSNNTDAHASKAVIYSVGDDHFDGVKDVFFNGTTFSTSPAMLNVMASNQPVGASTQADGIPILAGIGRRIALRSANRQRPEAEAIAAQRVESRVAPQFNEEVDSAFAKANVELQNKLVLPLQSEQLYPEYISTRSTDSDLTLSSRLMSDGKLGGGTAPLEAIGPDDVVFSFHESLLNNSLDLLPIAGKTMSEPEFEQLVSQKLKAFFPKLKLLAEGASKSEPEEGEPERIIFADQDPIRVRFEDGNVLLTIRAGFVRAAERGGNIAPQAITIPWSLALVGNQIVMTRGEISVEPLNTNAKVAKQVVTAGVIKSRLAKSFPGTSKSATTFKIDRPGKEAIPMRITEMTEQNGWLLVRATSEQSAQVFLSSSTGTE
jgi:hypothetical protein